MWNWTANSYRDLWFSQIMNLSGNQTLTRTTILCWLSLLLISPVSASEPLLKPFNAFFSVYRGIIPLGELELEFKLSEDGSYTYHAISTPGMLAGMFSGDQAVEQSQGVIDQQQVVPQLYFYQQEDRAEENSQLQFDWSEKKVRTTSKGITWSQPIASGTQDRLSQQLMVRLQLAQGSEDVEYQVADGGKIKRYRFRVVNRETLETPYGDLECLRVERSKESRPADYIIWFAIDLDYLPIRIEREKSGTRYKMVLEELSSGELLD